MTFATNNSRRIKTLSARFVALLYGILSAFSAETNNTIVTPRPEAPIARAERIFLETGTKYRATNGVTDLNWQFGQACFDWAEYATNDSQRAKIADEGIAACRAFIKSQPESAPGHYFLGMNLGQLARTKFLGALSIVDEMEVEFTTSRKLDEKFDYAGSDRNLGLLYRDAPSFGSIGDKSKARAHLESALQIAPSYPENRLNAIESYLKWGDRVAARRVLDALEKSLPDAHEEFSGPAWTASWLDWRQRLSKLRSDLGAPPKAIQSPRLKNN